MSNAVVMQLDTTFSNPALPVLSQLVARDNLLFAIRPTSAGVNDLLGGRKASFTLRGSPTFTSQYVECDADNAIVTTALETSAITLLLMCRIKSVGGNWQVFLGGSYTNTRGFSMYRTSSAINHQNVCAQSGTQTNRVASMGAVTIDPLEATLTRWGVFAMTLNPTTNKLNHFNSHTGLYVEVDQTALSRDLTQRDLNVSREIFVGTTVAPSIVTYPAKVQIGQAVCYNRALSESEIRKQVGYIKEHYAKFGIDVLSV